MTEKKRGRPPGTGRRTVATRDQRRLTIRPSDEERALLEEGARLAGVPEDGRARGPALAPWLLELGLAEARRLRDLEARAQRRRTR